MTTPLPDPVTVAADALAGHRKHCRANPARLDHPLCGTCVTLTAAWRQALREAAVTLVAGDK